MVICALSLSEKIVTIASVLDMSERHFRLGPQLEQADHGCSRVSSLCKIMYGVAKAPKETSTWRMNGLMYLNKIQFEITTIYL